MNIINSIVAVTHLLLTPVGPIALVDRPVKELGSQTRFELELNERGTADKPLRTHIEIMGFGSIELSDAGSPGRICSASVRPREGEREVGVRLQCRILAEHPGSQAFELQTAVTLAGRGKTKIAEMSLNGGVQVEVYLRSKS